MASMDHPHVVPLLGLSMGKKMMLVSQFVPLGSLLCFLRKHKERLKAKTMLTFSRQIAEVCILNAEWLPSCLHNCSRNSLCFCCIPFPSTCMLPGYGIS